MADGRKKNGGARKGAGRKPKEQSLKLIESLDRNINSTDWDNILKAVVKEAKKGSINHIKLLLEYRFGKPVQALEVEATTEATINISPIEWV